MKKLVLMAIALMAMTAAQAQSLTDFFKVSQERRANLQTLIDNYPKESGNEKVDAYGKEVYNAALAAVASSTQLENFYKREIGETVDGVTDVNIKKPTLEEWIMLGATVGAEVIEVTKAVDHAEDVAEEVKTMSETAAKEKNPMKAGKAAKSAKAAGVILEFTNQATPVLVEESNAQAKAVQEIIETLKSGKNL